MQINLLWFHFYLSIYAKQKLIGLHFRWKNQIRGKLKAASRTSARILNYNLPQRKSFLALTDTLIVYSDHRAVWHAGIRTIAGYTL